MSHVSINEISIVNLPASLGRMFVARQANTFSELTAASISDRDWPTSTTTAATMCDRFIGLVLSLRRGSNRLPSLMAGPNLSPGLQWSSGARSLSSVISNSVLERHIECDLSWQVACFNCHSDSGTLHTCIQLLVSSSYIWKTQISQNFYFLQRYGSMPWLHEDVDAFTNKQVLK